MPSIKSPEELAEAASFFPPGALKMLQRLLKRAIEAEVREARQSFTQAPSKAMTSGSRGGYLAAQLSKALKQRGATKREAPSTRQKAPDTGGRPFHFSHSNVKKDTCLADAAATSGVQIKSASHMKYIEREPAVEKTYRIEQDEGRAEPAREQAAQTTISEGVERSSTMSSAKAAQSYIENPVKLANGEQIVFSFGTIGDTIQDRIAFWVELEAAEKKNARVQSRIIVELPHEAPPADRFEIVKNFCALFDEMGLPYWAALHAPGKDNDSRNFHAHIVYSERPAKRMIDPADGCERWDFSIIETYKTSSRHIRERRPHKQNQHPFFRPMTAIKSLRHHFQNVANAILERGNVKDKEGEPVRYDARSYKDMGVDVAPMKSINRIVADKVNDGKLTVLDREYTKKMIRAEIKESFARRDKTTLEILRLENVLSAIAKNPTKAAAHNKELPKDMQISPLASLSDKSVRLAAKKIIQAKHDMLTQELMERSTRASIERILEATNPQIIKASLSQTRDPIKRAELPDAAAAQRLQDAAREELETFDTEARSARKVLRYRHGLAMSEWKNLTRMPIKSFSVVMKMIIDEQAPREGSREMRSGDRIQGQAGSPKKNVVDITKPATTEISERDSRNIQVEHACAAAPKPNDKPITPPVSRFAESFARFKAAKFKGSDADFMMHMQAASNATSDVIKAIAATPRLEDRLATLDSLVARKSELDRPREQTQHKVPENTGDTSSQEVQDLIAAEQQIQANTKKSKQATVQDPAVGDATTTPPPETAKQKAARRKKERKAILARRNGRNPGWER